MKRTLTGIVAATMVLGTGIDHAFGTTPMHRTTSTTHAPKASYDVKHKPVNRPHTRQSSFGTIARRSRGRRGR